MRVLLAEDDADLADAIARGLRQHSFAVDVAGDGADALDRARSVQYDVLVLDRDLPAVHGDVVCQLLTDEGSMPRVLMLTASGAIEDRVRGFALGADDYLAKPFAMDELAARVRALGRRSAYATPTVLNWRDVMLSPAYHRVERGGREITLTHREFAVLEQLLLAPGSVLSAEGLMARVWDDRLDPFSNIVRVTIHTLRRKLGDPPVIETVTGAGYRMV